MLVLRPKISDFCSLFERHWKEESSESKLLSNIDVLSRREVGTDNDEDDTENKNENDNATATMTMPIAIVMTLIGAIEIEITGTGTITKRILSTGPYIL